MIRINLLPTRVNKKVEAAKRQGVLAVIGLVAVIALCGWSYLSLASEVTSVEEENVVLQQDIDRLKKIIGQVEEFKAQKVELEKKIEVIKRLKSERTGPVFLLDEVAQAIPEKVWITKLTEKGPRVNIVGRSINMEYIGQFTEALRRSAHIESVEVGPTKRVKVKAADIYLQEFLLIVMQKTEKPEGEDKGKKKGGK